MTGIFRPVLEPGGPLLLSLSPACEGSGVLAAPERGAELGRGSPRWVLSCAARCSGLCSFQQCRCASGKSSTCCERTPPHPTQGLAIRFLYFLKQLSFFPPILSGIFPIHTGSWITASLLLQQYPNPGPERDDPLTLERDWLARKAAAQFRIYRSAATFGAITEQFEPSSVQDECLKWHSPLKGSYCLW